MTDNDGYLWWRRIGVLSGPANWLFRKDGNSWFIYKSGTTWKVQHHKHGIPDAILPEQFRTMRQARMYALGQGRSGR